MQGLAITPDGKKFVLGGAKLTVWDLGSSAPSVDLLEKIPEKELERPIRSVEISPDGTLLAAGDQKGFLRIWNLSDLSTVVTARAHDARLVQMAFSPNSQILATTSYSGEVRLWQMPEAKKIKSLKVSDQELARLVFVSDSLLASAGREATVWNIETAAKETTLTSGRVIGPSMGLSRDRSLLVFGDQESKVQFWDTTKSSPTGKGLQGAGAHLIDFSVDGKRIATYLKGSNLRIWDAISGQNLQVIDADGGQITAVQWLPHDGLLVASEGGRVRIWGTPDTAQALGLKRLELPVVAPIAADGRKPMSPAQSQRLIDLRSFPRLPGAIPQWGDVGMQGYTAPVSQSDAELFYRYYLGKAGWNEVEKSDGGLPGLNFRKQNSELNVSLNLIPAQSPGGKESLQVGLQFAGNYDVRGLPQYKSIQSKSAWNSFSSQIYRTKADLTDLEVGILKSFHAAGWTPYTRLNASSREEADSRTISFVQAGCVLTVSMGRPADAADEFSVQTSVHLSNKSLPIPADAGWIEFDSSTDLNLVANTKLDLQQTVAFYNTEMAAEGWLAREAGRQIKDEKGWLPYVRGQQDVLIRSGCSS